MALKVGELFASFNLDTSGIDGAVQSAENKMSNMGKSLAIGGAAMTAAVTVPLKQAASAIYEAGSGFDAQMSRVFAIAGDEVTGSTEAMEALRQKALDMGSTTQFTASEAGEAMEYMAMAGWKTDQMLAAIGPMMNLAAAAGADLGTTSDIVTDAMTAFGYAATDTVTVVKDGVEMEVNAVEHFADVLAAASSNSNTNVTMLGESFKFAAPLAGALGYSVDDVAIALGLMANNGIKSSMAGTSLSRIIQNMAKPSDQTAAAMEALGVSLYNDRGEAKSLREIMGDFRSEAKKNGVDVARLAADVADLDDQYASGKITEEQYTAKMEELTAGSGDFLRNLTQLAGARGLPGLLAIMNATDEDFEKLCGAIDNATGSASEMSRVMLDNAKGDITLFKSALEGLEITLWGLAENGFRKVVQEATKYVDAFRNADKSTQLGSLKMAGLAAAIGPVMTGLGGIISILPKLARTFAAVSGPTALLAIGLLALGAAAIDSNNDIGKTFVKGMNRAGQKFRQFGRNVEKQLPTLTTNMGKFLNSLSTGIANGLPGIMDGLTSLITTGIQAISANMPKIATVSQTIVKTLANSIKKNAPKIIPAILDLLTSMATALISNIPVVLQGMATVITSLIKEVNNADWSEIGSKLRTALEKATTDAGTLFKKLAMGDQYREDASWFDVGSAMIQNIMDGIQQGFGNLRDFIGSLLLGESYDPDEDFASFGSKIIDKVFEGIDGAAEGAASFVSGVLDGLSEIFSEANVSGAADALTTIAERIITGVANEIPKLAGHASTILTKLSELLVGDRSTKGVAASATEGASKLAGTIISTIAEAIPHALDAAGNVLDAGFTLATKLLDSISGAFTANNLDLNVGNIVQALVNNVVKVLGGALDFGNGLVTAGTRIAGELLNSLSGAFDGIVSTDGVSTIGEKVKTLAQNIITGIVTILPRVFEVGGKAVSAGMKLASELVSSLAEGFTSGEGLNLNFSDAAKGIVDGIVDAISNLPKYLGDVLSAGAQIVNSLMTSISTSLADLDASGIGGTMGTALTDLLKNLLGNIGGLKDNTEITTFLENIGHAIIDGMGALGNIVGEFCGKLLAYLFSVEGLKDIFNAGKTVFELILAGMETGLSGLLNFFGNMIDNVLIELGVIDPEARAKSAQSGSALASAMRAGMESELSGSVMGSSMLSLMDYILIHGGQGGQLSGENRLSSELNAWMNDTFRTAAENAGGNAEIFRDEVFESLLREKWNDFDFWRMLGVGADLDQDAADYNSSMWEAIDAALEGYDDYMDFFRENVNLSDFLPEDLDFWGAFLSAYNDQDYDALMDLMTQQAYKLFGKPTEEAGNAESEAEEAAEQAYEKMNQSAVETVQQGTADVVQAVQDGANSLAQAGMETTLVDSEEPVAAAAAAVSDAAVQEFLLVMSEENGSAIAESFVDGIIAILSSTEGIVAVASAMGAATRGAVISALRWLDGYNIGRNFGLGLLRGIESMIDSVASAAASLGNAAAGALSSSIEEGSPSRRTAESGQNFDLGFINQILAGAGEAGIAAASVGRSAAESLEETIGEVQSSAADEMSILPGYRRNEAETLAAENEKTAMTYASAIAQALSGAKVMMNGTLVGELVTDTVSEGIANRYAGRRYGTV